ncbi:MAG: hypothetical protein AAF990_19965 [Bacteroidota bacterium]
MKKLNAYLILFLLLGPWSNPLSAQRDTLVELGKNFLFEDGIYLSFESFRTNRPDFTWKELSADVYTNPQTFLTQLGRVNVRDSAGFSIHPDSLWGLSLGGIPYVRLAHRPFNKPMSVFAGLQLRGNICYFSFEDESVRKIPMPVYNPLTGKPYKVGFVERVQKLIYEKLMRFEDGSIVDFTLENFKEWIKDDEKLLNTVNDFTQQEVIDKLFKCLLIYDDRNIVKIRTTIEEPSKKRSSRQ